MNYIKKLTFVFMVVMIIALSSVIAFAVTYEYDDLGRLVGVSYGDKTEGTEESDAKASYDYDAGGNITGVSGFNNDSDEDRLTNYAWSFDSEKLSKLEAIKEEKTIGGLAFHATASSDMEVVAKAKDLNGETYTYTLNTKDSGSKKSRSISVGVGSNTDIYIVAKSSNNTARNLNIENSTGVVGNIGLSGSIAVYKYEYTGQDDDIYLYSTNGAVHIYSVAIRKHVDPTVEFDKTWDFSDSKFSAIKTTAIDSAVSVDGITVYNNVSRVTDSCNIYGKIYTNVLNFPAKGTTKSNSVSFEVNKNADIYVTAKASNSTRVLLLTNEYGLVLDQVTLTTTPQTYHLNYVGSGDKLYIRSQSSGVKLYSVSVKAEESNLKPINYTWNFGDESYNAYVGDINSNISINGLNINGASANMSLAKDVVASSKRLYQGSLNTNGTGTNVSRSLDIMVPSGTDMTLTASSCDSVNRDLLVINQYGYVLGKLTTSKEPTTISMKTTSDNEMVYIRSLNGNIQIQEISLGSGSGIKDGFVVPRYDIETTQTGFVSVAPKNVAAGVNWNYKSQLTTNELAIYSKLENKFLGGSQSFEEFTTIVFNNADVPYNDNNVGDINATIKNAMGAFVNDHPEVFWIDTFATTYNISEGRILTTTIWVTRISNLQSNEETQSAKTMFDSALTNLNSLCNSQTFNFEADYYRLHYVYEYLLANVDYSTTSSNKYNVYGAIVDGSAANDGLTRAFNLLCDNYGIKAVYARGVVGGLEHSWNYVLLDGEWYICDVARDARSNVETNEYFMIANNTSYTPMNASVFKNDDKKLKIFNYPIIANHSYYLWGDANLDNVLTNEDSDYLMAQVLSGNVFTLKRQHVNSDVDGNGILNSTDCSIILQALLSGFGINLADLVDGVEVTNEAIAQFDVNNDSVYDLDDVVIAVNNVGSKTDRVQARTTSTSHKTITKDEVMEMLGLKDN